ncbi:MAG: hypothetical protein JWN48_3177 [Myxococcaceae bacterium]|nr:hypothetical protein [Myxococcaceae bacterium]
MIRSELNLASIIVYTLAAAACSRELPTTASDSKGSEIARTATEASPDRLTPPMAKVAVWPDGWLIVSDEEWIPVLDETGETLTSARDSFVGGDALGAAVQTRAAAAAIRRNETARGASESASLEQQAKKLDALGARLELRKNVSTAELSKTIAEAYREAAGVTWLHLEEETLRPTFDKPQEHFDRALGLLSNRDDTAAADEIRRGAGYFRLASISARADDRPALDQQVAKLNHLAQRADLGSLTAPELKTALVEVDSAYAASYLHQAESEYQARQHADASRTLREAAARMRARGHWLGEEVHHASSAVAEELESMGDKLGHGVSVAIRKAAVVLEHAKEELGLQKRAPLPSRHHG